MFGTRPPAWDPASGRRPSDDQLMELLRERLRPMAPGLAAGSTVDHGVLAGRGGWSLLALPNHTGRPGHFDIGFVPAAGSEVIADCISGTGPMGDAVRQVLDIWAATSGACFLAMVDPTGAARPDERAGPVDGSGVADQFRAGRVDGSAAGDQSGAGRVDGSAAGDQSGAGRVDGSAAGDQSRATLLGGSDPAGIPGWQSLVSGVIVYGADPDALRTALLARPVLRETAPRLDRPANNGIKVYLHRTPTSTTGEVRVNGVPEVAATQALVALPWPEVSAPATARFYAVALHRD